MGGSQKLGVFLGAVFIYYFLGWLHCSSPLYIGQFSFVSWTGYRRWICRIVIRNSVGVERVFALHLLSDFLYYYPKGFKGGWIRMRGRRGSVAYCGRRRMQLTFEHVPAHRASWYGSERALVQWKNIEQIIEIHTGSPPSVHSPTQCTVFPHQNLPKYTLLYHL